MSTSFQATTNIGPSKTNKLIVLFLSLQIICGSIFTSVFTAVIATPAHADFITTSDIVEIEQVSYDREQLLTLLNNEQVQQQLISMGVSIDAAKARADRLTPLELAQFNKQLEEQPAGAGVVGIIVIFAVVFIITDVLGATDIFPFIKSIKISSSS